MGKVYVGQGDGTWKNSDGHVVWVLENPNTGEFFVNDKDGTYDVFNNEDDVASFLADDQL